MTPEQKAANEQLHEAILACRKAWDYADEYLVTDWVVVTAETKYDEDGDLVNAYGRLYYGGQMPDYRVLGLLDIHRTLLQHAITSQGVDEE